jgi:hypothetical protein
MIDRIDQWLINCVYQRIVDWSQRDGGWWIRETAFLCVVYEVVRLFSRYAEIIHENRMTFGICLDLACAVFFLWWAKDKVRIANVGAAKFFRQFLIIFSISFIPLDMWRYPFDIPTDIIFVSFYFFAACRPPKPREKREIKLAFNN